MLTCEAACIYINWVHCQNILVVCIECLILSNDQRLKLPFFQKKEIYKGQRRKKKERIKINGTLGTSQDKEIHMT